MGEFNVESNAEPAACRGDFPESCLALAEKYRGCGTEARWNPTKVRGNAAVLTERTLDIY
jgi:hypothetical protein